MAGQIVNRGKNVWLVRVFQGRDPKTDKRNYISRTVHGGKKDAERVLGQLLKDRDTIGRHTIGTTIGALLDTLVTDYRINGKDVGWCEMNVEVHLRPYFGKMLAAKLDTATIRDYISQRKQFDHSRNRKGAANASINNELALLRRAFNIAAKEEPPRVGRVPRIPKLDDKGNVRKGFFEDAQYRALYEQLPEHIRPVLAFGYYTGCRRGEVFNLKWEQVDLLTGIVRLNPGETKNDEARKIPLMADLLTLLRARREVRDTLHPACPWVFFHDTGKQIRSIKTAWANACVRAGLWDAEKKKPTHLFHDLRRSGVRNLIRAGVSEKVAQTISGHKTRAVFERYNITTDADLFAAAAKLQAYTEATRGTQENARAANRHTIGTQRKIAARS